MNACGCAKIGCSWLGLWPSKMWLAWRSAQAKMDVAQPKVAAKMKKWLHTCVQRVGVSRTLIMTFLERKGEKKKKKQILYIHKNMY